MSCLEQQYFEVLTEIAASAVRAGRNSDSVKLIAVSKTFPLEDIRKLYALGERRFGESKSPEFVEKAKNLPREIEWHFIGHLQSNKVKSVVEFASYIHSVDSVKLLERIDRIAGELGKKPKILIELNVSGEESKFGMSKEELRDVVQIKLEHATLAGLMTMAPDGADKETLTRVFSTLALTAKERALPELSMGMSGDFPEAVACGSTFVRIGGKIFGKRSYIL